MPSLQPCRLLSRSRHPRPVLAAAAAVIAFTLHFSTFAASPRATGLPTDNYEARAAKLFHREYFFHTWNESDHTVDGEDWSLPPWVKAAPYSGMQVPKSVSKEFPGRIQRGMRANWREVEPEEGRFDFAPLRAAILKASEQGKYSVKIGLAATVWETRYFRRLGDPAIARVDVGSAPRWLARYRVPIVEERPNASAPFQVVNLDIYHPSHLYDYTARRTDHANGQTLIRFGVDDTFLSGGPHRVAIKITYLDRDHAAWTLACQTSDQKTAIRSVTCGNTGKARTVTFILQDAWFPGQGYTGRDLQIQATQGDAVIRLVRVIKLR